jgi:hypothetical protein
MPKHKSILIGHRMVTAGKSRKCYHSPKHQIQKGDQLLEVRVGLGWQGYCLECAREMLQLAGDDLSALRRDLTP